MIALNGETQWGDSFGLINSILPMLSGWSLPDFVLVSIWILFDFYLVLTWSLHLIYLVSIWVLLHFYLIFTWFPVWQLMRAAQAGDRSLASKEKRRWEPLIEQYSSSTRPTSRQVNGKGKLKFVLFIDSWRRRSSGGLPVYRSTGRVYPLFKTWPAFNDFVRCLWSFRVSAEIWKSISL